MRRVHDFGLRIMRTTAIVGMFALFAIVTFAVRVIQSVAEELAFTWKATLALMKSAENGECDPTNAFLSRMEEE